MAGSYAEFDMLSLSFNMRRRDFLRGLGAAVLVSGCGSTMPPTAPGPITQPPPAPDPTPTPPAPTGPTPVLRITRILAFGDSLTEGTISPARTYGLLTAGLPQSYPFKLQTLTSARYTGQTISVLNGGKAGEWAKDTGTRQRCNDDLSQAKPELLLLMDGANDLLGLVGVPEPALGNGIQATLNAVEDLVRDATGRGIAVMLATLPPQRLGGVPKPRGDAAPFLGRYNDGLKSIASKKGAQLVDLFARVPLSLVGQDGLHLTEAGYQRVAEVFLETIRTAYEVTTTLAEP
jgi:lysophospholipase L1-like esterase